MQSNDQLDDNKRKTVIWFPTTGLLNWDYVITMEFFSLNLSQSESLFNLYSSTMHSFIRPSWSKTIVQMIIRNIIYLNCGETNEDMIDQLCT